MGREGSYPHHSAPYKVCLLQEFFTGSSSYTAGSIRPKTLAGGILSFVLLYFAGVQAVAKPEKRNSRSSKRSAVSFGGDEGDRTPYLLNAIQALSQVSYTPTGTKHIFNCAAVSRLLCNYSKFCTRCQPYFSIFSVHFSAHGFSLSEGACGSAAATTGFPASSIPFWAKRSFRYSRKSA